MSEFDALWSPEVSNADTYPVTPYGVMTSDRLQDGLEQIIDAQAGILPLAQLLVATQMGAL